MTMSILTNVPALTAARNFEQTLSSAPAGANLQTPPEAITEESPAEINPPGVGENLDVSA